MPQSFKFVFERGTTTRVPFQYQTVNENETRTPINLIGKRFTIKFRQRGKTADLLMLDSNEAANDFGAKLEITNAVAGKFEVLVTTAQIAEFETGYGEWELRFYDGADTSVLAEGNFSVSG